MRYKEHKTAFRNNSFAKHLNEEAQSFGPINNITKVLHFHKKGTHLNTIERFHIHDEFASSNHLDDNQTIFPIAIFDILIKIHQP